MRYSVPSPLVGARVDVRLTASAVVAMSGGEAVASPPRLHGRRGRYSTDPAHMPEGYCDQPSPWSPERLSSWARRVGPETGEAVGRLMASRPIVEQSFVACRNILGLSKAYSPELLERACAASNAAGSLPSYTAMKNSILAARAADAERRSLAGAPQAGPGAGVVDRAKSAGRVRGADAYRRGGERAC